MHSDSYRFESTHDVLKTLSFTLPTAGGSQQHQQQQQQQQQQQHLSETAEIDLFSFDHNSLGNFSIQLHGQHPTSVHNDMSPSTEPFESHYNAQHLTPDGRESIQYTNSSVLTSYNPEHIMSPVQISTQTSNGIFQRTSAAINIEDMTTFGDDEDFFSPLISPAITPAYDRIHRMSAGGGGGGGGGDSNSTNNNNMMELTFSPLTSPALHSMSYQTSLSTNGACTDPNSNISNEMLPESVLQEKLAIIEKQQQLLRSAHRQLQNHPILPNNINSGSSAAAATTTTTTSSMPMTVINAMGPTTAATQGITRYPSAPSHLQPHAPMAAAGTTVTPSSFSSSSSPTTSHFMYTQPPTASSSSSHGNFIAPATPSLLMKLGQGSNSGSTAASSTAESNLVSSAAVDRMTSLPAAMLEDKTPINKSATPKKLLLPNNHKRRRISRAPSEVFTSPGLHPTAALLSPRINVADRSLAALLSPAALRPLIPNSNHSNHVPPNGSVSAAPASGITSSPRALKPLISPSLKPNGKRLSPLEEQVATAALATKSNYQNMREGNARNLGIEFSSSFQSGVENRRSAHKAAEQKRRDNLKQSFEALRKEIASTMTESDILPSGSGGNAKEDGMPDDETKEKAVNQMSKVVLIQQSYEYILKLKAENRSKDDELKKLQEELAALQKELSVAKKGHEKNTLPSSSASATTSSASSSSEMPPSGEESPNNKAV